MLSASLPDFPWDLLEPAKTIAAGHPGGIVDLSVGTPVDPVPAAVRAALAAAADAPGYPLTAGTPARSNMIPSATVAALHEPQSPTAVMTRSHSSTTCWNSSGFTGVPK